MATTDPIADFLTRVRNGIMARHSEIKVPTSNMIRSIAKILHEEGFVGDLSEETEGASGKLAQGNLIVKLRYAADKSNVILGIKRESRPGQRRYVNVSEIPRVKNGMGIAIVSTSVGVMTGARARQLNVGGELVCTVW